MLFLCGAFAMNSPAVVQEKGEFRRWTADCRRECGCSVSVVLLTQRQLGRGPSRSDGKQTPVCMRLVQQTRSCCSTGAITAATAPVLYIATSLNCAFLERKSSRRFVQLFDVWIRRVKCETVYNLTSLKCSMGISTTVVEQMLVLKELMILFLSWQSLFFPPRCNRKMWTILWLFTFLKVDTVL